MLILYARFDYTELALPAIGTTLTLKTKALAAFRAIAQSLPKGWHRRLRVVFQRLDALVSLQAVRWQG